MSKQIDWTAEVAAWRASGLTARKFCEDRGYSATRLYWWSSQLKRSGSESEGSPPRTRSVPMARVVRKRSQPARGRAPIVIQVGNARVEVSGDIDRAALSAVLQTLADTSWGAQS
jgi:hypothetical protein